MWYDSVETFEAGKGLWHARIRRADLGPVMIDGVSFTALEVGFAWPDAGAAVADAKLRIDYLKRYTTVDHRPHMRLAAAS